MLIQRLCVLSHHDPGQQRALPRRHHPPGRIGPLRLRVEWRV